MTKLTTTRAFLSLLATLICVAAPAQPFSGPTQPRSGALIRVITYNVQFLPGIAAASNKRKDPEYRARRIAEEVSKFDIVALEETFFDRYREQIIETVRQSWGAHLNSMVSPKPEGRYANGGCLLLTRFPIVQSSSMVFEHFSKPEDFGVRADGFAAKGVIHARLALDESDRENTLDVFVTHLEARDDSLRPLQYKEMAEFIKKAAVPGRPVLLMGDLNTRGMIEYRNDPNSQYSVLLRELAGARSHGFVDLWPALHGDALGGTTNQDSADTGRRIDYILLSNPAPPASQLRPLSIAVNPFQDLRVVALSDHNAVTAEFEWNQK